MWFLISEINPDVKYTILGGKVYIVGRRDCDILVTGDASVSRKHAEISMSHTEVNLSNVSCLPILRMKDLSKFGTWVNKQRVEGERMLKDGDIIHFGSPSSSFMVVYEPLVVTSSCLDTGGKKSVRQTLCTLGGHMVNEWKQDCSLLIMNKISVTIKVICAMVSLKPIVTPAYLEVYLEHLQGKKEKPDSNKYIPELAETQVDPSEVSFKSDNRRRSIFEGKTFVFLSEKQLKKMQVAIELAGGLPMLLEGKVDRDLLLGHDSIVMSCPDSDITPQNQALVAKVTALLQKNGKHLIPDAEIGYAVLYCSTEKHCNPDHSPERDLSQLPPQTLSQVDPLVANTQTQASGAISTQKMKSQVQPEVNKKAPSSNNTNQTPADTMKVGSEDTERVAVKEEPLSGRVPSQRKSQKRNRIDDEDDDNETPVMSKKIKQEPVTPQSKQNQSGKSANRKPSPEPVSGKSFNRKPSPEPVSGKSANRKPSPEPVSPKSKWNQNGRSANKNPSPEPVKLQNEQQKSAKAANKKSNPEPVWDSDDDIDFSKIDTNITNISASSEHSTDKQSTSTSRRTSPRRNAKQTDLSDEDDIFSPKTRSRSPAKPKSTAKSPERRKTSPTVDLDKVKQQTISTRKVFPRRSRSRSPERIKEEPDEDMSEIIPNKRSRSPPSKNTTKSTTDRESKIVRKTEEESHRQENTVKVEQSDDEDIDVKSEQLNTAVPAGFLTTRKPIEKQVKRNKDYEEDSELPKACIQVEFTSLLVRRTQQNKEKDTTQCPDGYSKWKGKIVKNFKKFKKSEHVGSQGLPNIIGGSDLEVHQGQRSKEMDDWFKEALQAESQNATEDKRAQDLFDYNPAAKRRGR